MAWVLTYGPIPEDVWVLHHCDVRACVRPDHLYIGSPGDNARDREKRNPSPRGAAHPLSRVGRRNSPGEGTLSHKLTTEQVAEIRRLYQPNPHRRTGGLTQRQLADRFGVKQQAISKVLLGRTWGSGAHVPEPPRDAVDVVTDRQVARIRKRYAAGGISQQALAEEYDLSQTHISRIVRGQNR